MKSLPAQAGQLTRLMSLVAIPLLFGAGQDAPQRNQEAAAAYEAGEFDEALQIFTDALVDSPESPELHFNIGAAKYKLEHYDQALDEFRSVLLSADRELIAKAHYNAGNCIYRQAEQDMMQGRGEEVIQKYESAVRSYIEALKINPDDVQAKYNIELIRRKIKEMLDRQEAQQQQNQQEQDPQQQQATATDQETPTPQPSEEPEAEVAPQQPTPEYMSPEEAERLLESLDEEKREEMREQMRQMRRGAGVEADW